MEWITLNNVICIILLIVLAGAFLTIRRGKVKEGEYLRIIRATRRLIVKSIVSNDHLIINRTADYLEYFEDDPEELDLKSIREYIEQRCKSCL